MSLIHDALKRADADKRRELAAAGSAPVPASEARRTPPPRRARGRSVAMPVLRVFAVALAGYCLWVVAGRRGPKEAVGSVRDFLMQKWDLAESLQSALPAAPTGEGRSGPDLPDESGATMAAGPAKVTATELPPAIQSDAPAAADEPVPERPGEFAEAPGLANDLAEAGAPEMSTAEAGAPDPAAAGLPGEDAADPPAEAVAEAPAGPCPVGDETAAEPRPTEDRAPEETAVAVGPAPPGRSPAAVPDAPPAANPFKAPAKPTGAKATPAPSAAPSAGAAPAPAETPPAAPPQGKPAPSIDLSKYKVTTIMIGPRGAAAIVGGRAVVVGTRLAEGAVVAAITPFGVEVDVAGERLRLGR